MSRHHNTSACSGIPLDAECRYIKRRSTRVWEWTCTVRVRNHFLVAFICCDPTRIEHLDYCLKTMDPPLTLRSIRYDRSKSLNIPLSSSEGGTPSKPTFIPEEDDDDF
nr:PREDICTED: uncharacterized protein LOC109042197 [Bemisia tabaci]